MAWDHINGCARRELTVQYARTKDVVGPPTERMETPPAQTARPRSDSAAPTRPTRNAGVDTEFAALGVKPKGKPRGPQAQRNSS
jgi:hypothetical protein